MLSLVVPPLTGVGAATLQGWIERAGMGAGASLGEVVAKRFTDTGKWDKAWFRKLCPKMKCAWEYITNRCDHAGIWDIDFDTLTFFIGEDVSLLEALESFGDKIQVLESGKLFVPGFVEFQYGHLNPQNRVHASVISRLEKLGAYKPHTSPLEGAKDKDKDKEQEKEKEEGGVGETKTSAPEKSDPKYQLSTENLRNAFDVWLGTLQKLKAGRKDLLDDERRHISIAIQRHGVNAVIFALEGVPLAKAGDGFDPSWFLDVSRVLSPKNFMRFMNLGVQAWHKQKDSA